MFNLSKCLHAFVSELLNFGVKHVVICPGSRNFPLIKTFIAANKFVKLHNVVDERSAGFVALGLAQQSNEPVVVCCTSGTASLNLYPAIAEAYYSNTPLLVLTADRPASAIDNWEGQCVRQTNVFDNHTVASFQTPETLNEITTYQQIANAAIQAVISENGPAHVNIPFKEPFYSDWNEQIFNPVLQQPNSEIFDLIPETFKSAIDSTKNILWLNGASRVHVSYDYPTNLVVWSDVISNKNQTIDLWESLLLSHKSPKFTKPDLLITTGQYFVSKALRSYLRNTKNLQHWHINDGSVIPTPFHTAPKSINCDVQSVLDIISQKYKAEHLFKSMHSANARMTTTWAQIDWEVFTEFSTLRKAYKDLPAEAILHISNSMPIRYLGFLQNRDDIIHAANRGTSGIDGCTSTAVGYALATDKPVYLFTGDLAFLYDINGLWQKDMPTNLRIVVFNNEGGGIFELIDGPSEHPESLPYQVTEHNRSIAEIASHFNFDYHLANDFISMKSALGKMTESTKQVILEVKTERGLNKSFLNSYKDAVKRAFNNDK